MDMIKEGNKTQLEKFLPFCTFGSKFGDAVEYCGGRAKDDSTTSFWYVSFFEYASALILFGKDLPNKVDSVMSVWNWV
jgi:hypothetical protein